jgi:hypothetical protein
MQHQFGPTYNLTPYEVGPTSIFYNFPQAPLIKIPPIAMGRTYHRAIHLWNGPTAMQQ